MKEKILNFKNFVLYKLLPIICIITLFMSFFVIVPSASIITDNEFVLEGNSYTDFFSLAPVPYNNEFEFQTTGNPEWYSPVLYSNSLNSALDTLTLQFQYSDKLKQWFHSNNAADERVKITIPFVFYNSSTSHNYYPPSKVSVSIRTSSGTTESLGSFNPVITTISYVVFNLSFEYTNDFTTATTNSPILSFNFTVPNNNTVNDEVLGGLASYSIGGKYYNKIKFKVDVLPDPPSVVNPDTDNWHHNFGSGVNDYFATEEQLNSVVDHDWINSFFANISAIDNEVMGLGAVRRIMNEFINYNGSQYTWLSNLLHISLYLGMISFVLGFSVYFMGSIRRKK